MQLNVKERLILPRLMPPNGTYKQLVAIRGICEAVKVTDEELKELGVTVTPQGLSGLTEKSEKITRGYDFTFEEQALVSKELVGLEKKGHLNLEVLGLFEKFVGAPQETAIGESIAKEQKLLPKPQSAGLKSLGKPK